MCKSQSRKIITGFSLKQGTWDYQSAELVFWRLCQCPGDFWLMLLSTHIPGWGCSTWGRDGSIRDTNLPQAQSGSEDAVKLMPSTSKISSPPPSHINELRQHWSPTPNPANYLQSPHPQAGRASRKQDCSPNTGSCCREQGFSFTPEQPTPAPNNQSPAPGRCQHWDLHHLCKFPAPEKDSWERRMLQHRPALALSTESSTGGHSAVRAQDTSFFVLANAFVF